MKLNEIGQGLYRKKEKELEEEKLLDGEKPQEEGIMVKKSRAGGKVHHAFEGGQTPIIKRTPKRGFSNHPFKKEYTIVNLSIIDKKFEDGAEITPEILMEKGVIKKLLDGVKILGKGDIEKKFDIKVHKISKAAKEKVESAGGTVSLIQVSTFADIAGN